MRVPHELLFTRDTAAVMAALAASPRHAIKLRKVRKTLAWLERDPRHPGLNSHKFRGATGDGGEDIWDSYVENNTPSAWRIFWHYGPTEGVITVVFIGPHL